MKRKHLILTAVICCSFAGIVKSQTTLTNAILKASVEITRESSGGDNDGRQVSPGTQQSEFRFYIKENKSKMVNESDNMNSMIFVDRNAKTTTQLFEAMGSKTGFIQTDEEKLMSRKNMDSAMKNNNGQGNGPRFQDQRRTFSIEYVEETKTINKINCKKAIVISKRPNGEETRFDLWYCPDYILPEGLDFGRFLPVRDLKGIPVKYESVNKMNFGDREITLTTQFELTSLETNANIKDKEFEIPSGFDIKPWSEWQKQNRGPGGMPGMRMMIRNNP